VASEDLHLKGDDRIVYLSRVDVQRLRPSLSETVQIIEDLFRIKGSGGYQMPPKIGLHLARDGSIYAMPGWVEGYPAGVKWIGGYPSNPQKGLPNITGLVVLNDVETGLPVCIMDCSLVTALRTAAATVVSARYLARREARSVGIIGCGVQGEMNAHALAQEIPCVESFFLFDKDPERSRALASNLRGKFSFEVRCSPSPREVLENAEIVVTATLIRPSAGVIRREWVKEGSFYAPLELDSYWTKDALASVDKLVTDDIDQYLEYQGHGFFRGAPPVYAELAELVRGSKPGREDDAETTMAMNIGIALEDVAVASRIYEKALRQGPATLLER